MVAESNAGFRVALATSIGLHVVGFAVGSYWNVESVQPPRVDLESGAMSVRLVVLPQEPPPRPEEPPPEVVQEPPPEPESEPEPLPEPPEPEPVPEPEPELAVVEPLEPPPERSPPDEPPPEELAEELPEDLPEESAAVNSVASEGALSEPVPEDANKAPEYPRRARRRGEQGLVVLRLDVLETGRVGGAVVHRTSGYPLLDQAALRAVKRWRYHPARRGSSTVRFADFLQPVKFVLE